MAQQQLQQASGNYFSEPLEKGQLTLHDLNFLPGTKSSSVTDMGAPPNPSGSQTTSPPSSDPPKGAKSGSKKRGAPDDSTEQSDDDEGVELTTKKKGAARKPNGNKKGKKAIDEAFSKPEDTKVDVINLFNEEEDERKGVSCKIGRDMALEYKKYYDGRWYAGISRHFPNQERPSWWTLSAASLEALKKAIPIVEKAMGISHSNDTQ